MSVPADNLLPPNEAKRRTARIETDYVRRRNPFDVWKGRLALLAALVAIGWIAIAAVGDREQQLASRGPVAHAHAMWENNCQACHVDFTPITGRAAGFALTEWAHASDQNCQKCHTGPGHHAAHALLNASADIASANCATCHVEHRGRDADLSRVADRHCTVCHADLTNHSRRAIDPSIAQVGAFSIDAHPQFRSLTKDPGRLKFNHALHMTAGLMHAKDGRQPFTVADLPAEFRARYAQNVTAKKHIQLDCTSCHELDRDDSSPATDGLPSAVEAAHGRGEYYRPVIYERHCQACHPLPYQPGLAYSPEAQLPHRLNAQRLEQRVRDMVLASLVRQTPELQDLPLETIPGNEPPDMLTDTGRAWVESRVNQSAHYLKTALCAECHESQEAAASDSQGALFPDVPAVEVPLTWFKHARFDHAAHRAVTCVECHAGAYSDSSDASRVAGDVLLPGIENCVRCHAPRRELRGEMVGGARHDCVECHAYHGRGDDALDHGQTWLRGAKQPRSIDAFLNLENRGE